MRYLVLLQIGGSGDPEIWLPGSYIELSDEKARLHLAAGSIAPFNPTDVPEEPISQVVVHQEENN